MVIKMTTAYAKAARYFDQVMVPPLRQMLVGRKLFASTKVLPAGTFNVDYNKITEMGSAIIGRGMPQGDIERDDIVVAVTNLELLVLSKGYQIQRSNFEAFRSKGVDLDTEAMLSAAHVVGLVEDDLLIQGWDPDGDNTYEVSGLYQGAGNTEATAADFATAGKAMTKVSLMLALNYADDVFGVNYNLTLNPTQFNELAASLLASGYPEWPEVLRLLNPVPDAPKGNIFISNDITAGTCLMSPVDPSGRFIDLVVGQDAMNVVGLDSRLGDYGPLYGTVLEILAPRIKHSVAVCKGTGI